MIPTRSVQEVDPGEWDRLVQSLPAHTVFHGSPWLRAVRDACEFALRLFVLEEAGEVIAGWPLFVARRGPFRTLGSPFPGTSTPYLGPLFSDTCDAPAAIDAFLGDPRIGRYSVAFCRVMDAHRIVRLDSWGFSCARRSETYLLDISRSEEELWAGVRAGCRGRIRKARNSPLVIQRETAADFVEELWPIALSVFARSGMQPNFSRRFLREVWRNLTQMKQLVAYSARHEGRAVAFLLLPLDAHTIYYWAGGALGEFAHLAPNNLLHWQAILDARARGLRYYDFVSTRGGPGRFKATFGADATHVCTHWEHERSRLAMWARRLYEAMARAERRLRPVPRIPGF